MTACAWTGHDRTRMRGARNRTGVRGLLLWLIRPSNRSGEGTTFWLLGSLLPSLALTALTVAAGTTLIIGHGGGLYWLAPAVVIAFATGLAGAWVLLVEILR